MNRLEARKKLQPKVNYFVRRIQDIKSFENVDAFENGILDYMEYAYQYGLKEGYEQCNELVQQVDSLPSTESIND